MKTLELTDKEAKWLHYLINLLAKHNREDIMGMNMKLGYKLPPYNASGEENVQFQEKIESLVKNNKNEN